VLTGNTGNTRTNLGHIATFFTKMTNNLQLCRIIYCSLTALHVSNDIFTHNQEHLNCNYSFWFHSRVPLAAAVSILMMSENIARNMWSSQGTINYPKQLHLVGHFCKNCIMVHGTMNVSITTYLRKNQCLFQSIKFTLEQATKA